MVPLRANPLLSSALLAGMLSSGGDLLSSPHTTKTPSSFRGLPEALCALHMPSALSLAAGDGALSALGPSGQRQIDRISATAAFGRLSEDEQRAVRSLAALELPNFEALCLTDLDSPLSSRPRSELLTAGAPILTRLAALAELPVTRFGLPGRAVLSQLLQGAANPGLLRQLGPTCFSTVLVHQLATSSPSGYLRLHLDLLETGEAVNHLGFRLAFSQSWMPVDGVSPPPLPVGQVLPWALHQSLTRRPISSVRDIAGFDEISVGVDAARFLGQDIVLSLRARAGTLPLSVGDITFLTPDLSRTGHVFQVLAVNQGSVSLYDPNGGRGISAMIDQRAPRMPGEHAIADGKVLHINPELLQRITASTYRCTPLSGDAPRFVIITPGGARHEFSDRESLMAFRERHSSGNGRPRLWEEGTLPFAVVLGAVAAGALWRLARRRAPAPPEQGPLGRGG